MNTYIKLLLVVLAVVALAELTQAKTSKKNSDWIKSENPKWPKWGARKIRWLKHELAEAKRDLADATTEKTVVDSWGRSFVAHRASEFTARINNRRNECASFEKLLSIRRGNWKYHKSVHRAIKRGRKPFASKKSQKTSSIASNTTYKRKFSTHARMLVVSKGRLRAAKAALARCRGSVKKLTTRRQVAKAKAKKIADKARARSDAHIARVRRILNKIRRRLAAQKKRVADRVAAYKPYFFHVCKRVRRYRYKCFLSTRHGNGENSRRPYKFFRCYHNSATSNGIRFTCHK